MNYENQVGDNAISINTDIPEITKTYTPHRLAWIQKINNCDFCIRPTGPIFLHHTDFDNILGFISCKSCIEIGHNTVLNWKASRTYGRVEHLRNRRIKIYRCGIVDQKKSDITGVSPDTPNFLHIQDGWMINSYIDIIDNKEYVGCRMLLSLLMKKCKVDDLILLNGSE